MDQKDQFPVSYIYPPQPFTSRGSSTPIDSNAICQKLVYCVSNIVVVRSTANPRECTIFDQHKFETTAARISPSGNLCASADNHGTVFIWEVNTPGHPISKTYEQVLCGSIYDISWTMDNQRLVVAGDGKTYFAKAILVDTGSNLGDITGLAKRTLCCDLRPQRPFRLAVGGEESIVGFYEGPPFKFKKTSKQHTNYVTCLRYNKNGELFVTGSNDRKIYLYEGKDCNELKEIKSATPHERSVTSVAWFDDKTFASSSNDTTVKLWTVNDEEGLLKTLRVEEKPHEIEEMQVSLTISNDDVYTISLFGCLNFWKQAQTLADGAFPTARFHGHQNVVGCLLQDAEKKLLFSGDYNGKICNFYFINHQSLVIWSGQDAYLPVGLGHPKQVIGLGLNSDRTKVFSLGGEELRRLDIQSRTFDQKAECKGQTLGLAVSGKDPNTVFVLFENSLVQKYVNFEMTKEYALEYETSVIAIAPDDSSLFVGDKKGVVHAIDIESGNETHKFEMWGTRITAITVAATKKWLLIGDTTGKIKLFDYETKTEIYGERWVFHTTIVSSLSFSESCKWVLSTSQDNKFMIWDTESGQRTFEKQDAHKRGILTGLICHNTGNIITSGGDNAVKVWQPTSPLK